MMQLSIDYTARIENNKQSQAILEANKDRLNKQCQIVMDALKRGERLTTASALLQYGIGDLRRRVKDLRDYHSINIQSELKEGRFKEYFLDNEWLNKQSNG
jgi:hypothetical protein